jgi:hypothetical protein
VTDEHKYRYYLTSLIGPPRDGMVIELHDASGEVVAEIFEDDVTGACSFSVVQGARVPTDVVWDLLRVAADEFPGAVAPDDSLGP